MVAILDITTEWTLGRCLNAGRISHYRVTFTSLSERVLVHKPFIWKCICFVRRQKCKQNSFPLIGCAPGPGCIKITWDFLQPFPVLWGVFSRAYKDKSGENVLESTGKSITLWKHSPERREQMQKIARNLKHFYATGPRTRFETEGKGNFVENGLFTFPADITPNCIINDLVIDKSEKENGK